MKPTLQASGLYFAIVPGAGFVLGGFRVPVLVPRLRRASGPGDAHA